MNPKSPKENHMFTVPDTANALLYIYISTIGSSRINHLIIYRYDIYTCCHIYTDIIVSIKAK